MLSESPLFTRSFGPSKRHPVDGTSVRKGVIFQNGSNPEKPEDGDGTDGALPVFGPLPSRAFL